MTTAKEALEIIDKYGGISSSLMDCEFYDKPNEVKRDFTDVIEKALRLLAAVEENGIEVFVTPDGRWLYEHDLLKETTNDDA